MYTTGRGEYPTERPDRSVARYSPVVRSTVRERLRDATPTPVRNAVHRARRAGDERFAGSIASVQTGDPVVAFTYDDGPHPERTPAIAAALEARGARGTFFVLAPEAERHPDIVRRLVAAGHAVGLHGAEHRNLRRCNIGEARALIAGGKRRLEAVLGAPVRLFRPPFGEQTRRSFALARASGMSVVVWSTNTRDCYRATIDEYVANASPGLHEGAIVLFHDGLAPADPRAPIADEPPPADFDRVVLAHRMLDLAAERGLEVVPVTDLLTHGAARRVVWLD
jgi:peptidoglycan/xylan/chitin deacetylase (PgdA/CDA1 family)